MPKKSTIQIEEVTEPKNWLAIAKQTAEIIELIEINQNYRNQFTTGSATLFYDTIITNLKSMLAEIEANK